MTGDFEMPLPEALFPQGQQIIVGTFITFPSPKLNKCGFDENINWT